MVTGNYFVYITTNPERSTLYAGVTNDLRVHVQQHYLNKGNKKIFAGRYYCYQLVYFEVFSDLKQAIAREKEIKNMTREKKDALIATKNPKRDFLRV